MADKFIENLYPGQVFQGFHYDEILYEAKSPFQSIATIVLSAS